MAEACQKYDVERLLFASSTSVYGDAKGLSMVDEESPLNPLSLYARTKMMSEQYLLAKYRGKGLPVCCLRVATNYGPSRRMRFDLVVNKFAYMARWFGRITVYGGKQWRPFIHTHDTARAYELFLRLPLALIKGEVYNVSNTAGNYRIIDLAELVKELVPGTKIEIKEEVKDPRSYRVSFRKIEKKTGFKTEKNVRTGLLEVLEFLKFLNQDY